MTALDQITTDVSPRRSSHRKRVLVVEDESLVALLVTEQVAEMGYTVIGPACTMAEARKLATTASIDGALLDLKLHGARSDEVANILTLRQIPFAFITGYNEPPDGLYKNIDVLHKPFQLADLSRASWLRVPDFGGTLRRLRKAGPIGGLKSCVASENSGLLVAVL